MTRWSNLPKKIINKRDEGDNMYTNVARPTANSKDDIKCTLLLTTEMGECRGWENSTSPCPKAKGKDDIKCTPLADHRNGGMSRLGPEGY